MPTEQKKGILEELQALTAEKKRSVLIVGTVVAMAILIYVWIGYFNGLIVGTLQSPVAQATTTSTSTPPTAATTSIAIAPTPAASAPAAPSGPSMWQDIKNAAGSFANMFERPSDYSIQPKSN